MRTEHRLLPYRGYCRTASALRHIPVRAPLRWHDVERLSRCSELRIQRRTRGRSLRARDPLWRSGRHIWPGGRSALLRQITGLVERVLARLDADDGGRTDPDYRGN